MDNLEIDKLEDLLTDLEEHSAGPMLERGISSLLSGLLRIEGEPEIENPGQPSEAIESVQGEQRSTIQKLWDKHATTLNTLGLSIASRGSGANVMTGSGTVQGERASLILQKPEKLEAFLRGLAEDDLADERMKKNIDGLVVALEAQLFETDWENPSEEALKLVQCLPTLIAETGRIGLTEITSRLDQHDRWLSARAMHEYASIRSESLLRKPGDGFGPADWDRDITPKLYEKRWETALSLLKNLQQKPRAKDVAKELRSHLLECASEAKTRLENLGEDTDQAALLAILNTTISELEKSHS